MPQQAAREILNPTHADDVTSFRYAGTVRDCSFPAAQILGLTPEQFTGRSLIELSPAQQADGRPSTTLLDERLAAARGGLPQSFLWNFRDTAGEISCLLQIDYQVNTQEFDCRIQRLSEGRAAEGKRTELALRNVAMNVTSVTGKNVLQEIARLVADTLGVAFAYVGACNGQQSCRMRTLAICLDGKSIDNLDYELSNTPCERVVGKEFHFISAGIISEYPGDGMLTELGFDSYAGYPLFDSQGRPIGIIAALDRGPMPDRDLAESILKVFSVRAAAELERMESERSLQTSEEQYRTIFTSASDGISLWSPDEKLVDANPAFAQMYGYELDEMFSIDPTNLVADASRDDYQAFLEAATAGESFNAEMTMRRKDGSHFIADIRGVGINYQERPHYLTLERNVTEQRERELALAHSQERLRATVESSLDCIIGMHADGTIAEFNPMAEKCFGHRRDDVLGKSLSELIIPERYREAHEQGLARFRAQRDGPYIGRRIRIEARHADGSEFPAELTVSVARQPDGDIFIGYLRDLSEQEQHETDRERLEVQLRQAQKMEAIGHLAGGIAHDFNNLLTSLLGYSTLARDHAEQNGDCKTVRFLDKSLRSGRKAGELIRQLLTFSRGQKGEPRPLELTPLLEEFTQLLESTLPSSVRFFTEYDENLSCVMLDPVQVEQVLMNLCINARDAMNGSGNLYISLKQRQYEDGVCCSCRQCVNGSHVELSVRDTGPGIADAVIDRMFEPFFSTKETGKGSGMGLSTVHGIVHDNGGHIFVENLPEGGAGFRVMFPALEQTEAAALTGVATEKAAAAGQLTGTVLLVDDDLSVVEFMVDLLSDWGLDVKVFTDSRDAQCMVDREEFDFDLAILDQVMAGLTGCELAKWLNDRQATLPIILYSGFSGKLCDTDVKNAGVSAMLRKPVDTAEMRKAVKRLLAQ